MSMLENVIALFYALVGFTGAISFVLFAWGLGLYLSRMGTERREDGLTRMREGVSVMLASIVLIWLLRFFESLQ